MGDAPLRSGLLRSRYHFVSLAPAGKRPAIKKDQVDAAARGQIPCRLDHRPRTQLVLRARVIGQLAGKNRRANPVLIEDGYRLSRIESLLKRMRQRALPSPRQPGQQHPRRHPFRIVEARFSRPLLFYTGQMRQGTAMSGSPRRVYATGWTPRLPLDTLAGELAGEPEP